MSPDGFLGTSGVRMMNARRILSTHKRILLWVTACAMAIIATPEVLIPSPASAASAPAGAPSFVFAPYNEATQGVIRASLHYTILPGSSITDEIVLANPEPYEQTFRIWGADAYNTALGGALALRLDGYPMSQVGTWITLPTKGADYGVSAGQEVILKFALTVPPNAIPGDHVGGIEALNITPPQTNGSSNRVLVHEGIGVPIFIHVPGPRHPSAAVTFVGAASSVPWLAFATGSSQARVGYQIENTGNTILRGKVHVWVTNLFGQTVKTFPDSVLGNLLPSQQANFAEPLWKSLPIAGPQTIHVTFSSAGAKPATGSATFWIVPWLLIILILLIVLGLVAWLWRRHRRKIADGTIAEGEGETGGAEEVARDATPHEPVPTT